MIYSIGPEQIRPEQARPKQIRHVVSRAEQIMADSIGLVWIRSVLVTRWS